MSRAAGDHEIWGWIAGRSPRRGAMARRPQTWLRPGASRLFLFLLISTAVVPAARADAFAAGVAGLRRPELRAGGPDLSAPCRAARCARANLSRRDVSAWPGRPAEFRRRRLLAPSCFGGRPPHGPVLPWFDVRQGTGRGAGLRARRSVAEPRRGACRAETARPLGAHSRRGRLEDERVRNSPKPGNWRTSGGRNRLWRSIGV